MCLELCIRPNNGHLGENYTPAGQLVANWEECAYLCQQDEACAAWTYFSEDYSDANAWKKCFLKPSGNWNPKRDGVISGLKNCITGLL